MKSIQDLVYRVADKDKDDPVRHGMVTLTVDEMQRFRALAIAEEHKRLLEGSEKPALWHDPETGHWKKLTKPDRPTYEGFYTADQMAAAVLRERIKTLESVVELSTVGATYPELMKYLQAQIEAMRGNNEND